MILIPFTISQISNPSHFQIVYINDHFNSAQKLFISMHITYRISHIAHRTLKKLYLARFHCLGILWNSRKNQPIRFRRDIWIWSKSIIYFVFIISIQPINLFIYLHSKYFSISSLSYCRLLAFLGLPLLLLLLSPHSISPLYDKRTLKSHYKLMKEKAKSLWWRDLISNIHK